MRQIDMNSDMGESFGKYKLGNDEEIMICGYALDPSEKYSEIGSRSN